MHDIDHHSEHAPTLVSLAGFALVFGGLWAVLFLDLLPLEAWRTWLSDMDPAIQGGLLTALILGIMAIQRIMVLIGKGFDRRSK